MHASSSPPAGATSRRLTRRAVAKQQTRADILAAGRHLFDERGYDGATLRDVATAAHVSTGAVFGNFANKAALLAGVINADCEILDRRLDAAIAANGSATEAVVRLLTIAQEHHAGALGLLRTAMSFVWRQDVGAELAELKGPGLINRRVCAILRRGIKAGELSLPFDVRIVAGQLLTGYLAAYGPAFASLSEDQVRAAQIAQARALLAGYAAGRRCTRAA